MKSIYGTNIGDPGRKPSGLEYVRSRFGRRRAGWLLVGALAAVIGLLAWTSFQTRADTAYNTHNLIRLHVVANSDQTTDQAVKLEVRDAILKASGDLFTGEMPGVAPPDEAVLVVQQNLPLFKRVAENVLAANGYGYPVDVEFGTFAFPERAYGPLVLPAGSYEALRVILGEGQGANWWCILFPPLCYLDVVGGNRQTDWGLTESGSLAGAAGGTAAGKAGSGSGKVVSLDSLTADQIEDLETVLGRALESMEKPGVSGKATAGDGGVKVILSDIPSSPDTDLVILVADTGTSRTEVRFYVFDKLRDFIRSLADAFPWFVESLPEGPQETAPER